MDMLPHIDAEKVMPTPDQAFRLLSQLHAETKSFAESFGTSAHMLSHKGLTDATAWYGGIQMLGASLMHIAEFYTLKPPAEPDFAERVEGTTLSFMQRVTFFAEFLKEAPIETLVHLTNESSLEKAKPLLSLMMDSDYRRRTSLPSPELQGIADRLNGHFSGLMDHDAAFVLSKLANAVFAAANEGDRDPVRFAERSNYMDAREVRALRSALEKNKPALKVYIQDRKIAMARAISEPGDLFDFESDDIIHFERVLGWKAAAAIAVGSHAAVAPHLGKTAQSIFDDGLIEATPTVQAPGYTIMASAVYPPIIFTGFRGSLFNGQELAHHVAQGALLIERSRGQELKPYDTPAINEILPDLIERVYWDQIAKGDHASVDQKSLARDNVAGSLARYAVIDEFNRNASDLLRSTTKFDLKDLDAGWAASQTSFFGEKAAAAPGTWRALPFIAENPFGAIPHIYAQLVAERMYQEHQKDPDGFAPKLLSFLQDTGKERPAALLKKAGFDTSDPAFWTEALRDIRNPEPPALKAAPQGSPRAKL